MKKQYCSILFLTGVLLFPVNQEIMGKISFTPANETGETQQAKVTVQGTVTDTNGESLTGASVIEQGTQNSAMTDVNGHYSITVSQGAALTFSFIGYETVTLQVTSGILDVRMVEDSQSLDEVVVTAMGIKKERKALGYSVSELNSAELLKNKNTNVINSLVGKVPGVNVTQSSGAAGAGAAITIRGGNSTSDSRANQPLFVVDGVIYDNSTTVVGNTATDGMSRSNTTYSNRVMDINPEDIETMSVLKGAAASALYGSRAADGVVIITTKKGAEGTVKVDFSSKISTARANKLPEAQTVFGPGYYTSNGVPQTDTYDSWGERIAAGTPIYDNIGNFFRSGVVYDNNVNVSGGTKNSSFYLSASNYNQGGIVPTTDYDKTTFRFNGEQKYGRLTLDANVSYSIANTTRTLTVGGLWADAAQDGAGSMDALFRWPQTMDMSRYINPDGSQYRPFANIWDLSQDIDNPYWIINKDDLNSETKRFTGGISGNFKIADWWDVTARLGYDNYITRDYTYIAPGSAVNPMYQNGRLSKNVYDYTYLSTNVMSNFHKTFGDFDTHLLLGTMSENTEWANQTHWGYNFVTEGTISFNNIAIGNKNFQDATTKKRLVGVYGEFGLSYKSLAYITVTGRNDWSSTLPVENRSYFYPSVSGAIVFTELMPKNDVLSFGKIRASWAQVGKDANPYATLTSVWPSYPYGTFTMIGNQWQSGNTYLKPEIQTSWEIGGELQFLNGRIGLDYTYYHSQTENQIAQPRLSNASGYIFTSINSGSVINRGMEIAITGKPVVNKNFEWNIMLNTSYNRGRLGEFLEGVTYFYPTDAQFGTIRAASIPNGGYFLGMTGRRALRETEKVTTTIINDKGEEETKTEDVEIKNGRYKVDPATGLYLLSSTSNDQIVGNREPKLIGGLNNTFRYKDLTLSFLLDFRLGGDIYNGTDYFMVVHGLSKSTLANDRQQVTVSGVDSQTGEPVTNVYNSDQNYTIGGVSYSGKYMIQQYWSNYAANAENFITSVNWLKLRSLALTYDLTDLIKRQKVIKALSATVTGYNLLTLTNYKGMDPEVSAAGGTGGSGSTGIDYVGVPAVSSFTFGINITF